MNGQKECFNRHVYLSIVPLYPSKGCSCGLVQPVNHGGEVNAHHTNSVPTHVSSVYCRELVKTKSWIVPKVWEISALTVFFLSILCWNTSSEYSYIDGNSMQRWENKLANMVSLELVSACVYLTVRVVYRAVGIGPFGHFWPRGEGGGQTSNGQGAFRRGIEELSRPRNNIN